MRITVSPDRAQRIAESIMERAELARSHNGEVRVRIGFDEITTEVLVHIGVVEGGIISSEDWK